MKICKYNTVFTSECRGKKRSIFHSDYLATPHIFRDAERKIFLISRKKNGLFRFDRCVSGKIACSLAVEKATLFPRPTPSAPARGENGKATLSGIRIFVRRSRRNVRRASYRLGNLHLLKHTHSFARSPVHRHAHTNVTCQRKST